MSLRIFQIVVPIIALVFLAGIWTRYRRERIGPKAFVLSALFWIGVAVFCLFPDPISGFLADLTGIKSNVNAVIFLGLGVLSYLVFLLLGEVRENRRQITELTRKIALRDAEEEKA